MAGYLTGKISGFMGSPVPSGGGDGGGGIPDPNLCEVCKQKPKFVENGHVHPFCGRACAAKAPKPAATRWPATAYVVQQNVTTYQTHRPGPVPGQICKIGGCPAPATASGYCSDQHLNDAFKKGDVKACSQCKLRPRNPGHKFCSRTCAAAAGPQNIGIFGGFSNQPSPSTTQNFQAPRFNGVRLDEKGPQSISGRDAAVAFTDAWKEANNGKPTVQKVYSVHLPRDLLDTYEKNRNKLDNTGRLRTIPAYFGGQCVCDIGAHGPAQTCSKLSCAICMVINNRFEKFAFNEKYLNGPRGKGVYSHQNPAQANEHVTETSTSPFRAMIMCEIDIDVKGVDKAINPTSGSVFVDSAAGITPKYLILYTKPLPPAPYP